MAKVIILTDEMYDSIIREINRGLTAGRSACDPGATQSVILREGYPEMIDLGKGALVTLTQYVHEVK